MKINFLCAYFFSSLFPYVLHATELTVIVENIEIAEGTVNIAVFTAEDDFPEPSSELPGISIPAIKGKVSATFTELPENTYAVAVYQDKNSNNKLDKNFFGIPKEPYGFSDDSTQLIPPDFAKASFSFGSTDKKLHIKLR